MVFGLFRRRDEKQPEEQPAVPAAPAAQPGATLTQSLERTRGGFFGAVRSLFQARRELDESFWDDLEERLIQVINGIESAWLKRQRGEGETQRPTSLHIVLRLKAEAMAIPLRPFACENETAQERADLLGVGPRRPAVYRFLQHE